MTEQATRGRPPGSADEEMSRLIERRHQLMNPEEQRVEDLFEETTRRHREKLREEHRLAWYCYHLDTAERLRRTMTVLVEKHEAAAAQLLDGPGERGEES